MPKPLEFLGQLAPLLGTAIAGPFGGVAASFVAKKLGLGEETVEAVTQALSGNALSPEQVVAVKNAELEFKKFLEDNKIKLEALYLDDRKSAREREIALKDWTPMALAWLITLGFFATLATFLFVEVPDGAKEAMLLMLGTLQAAWMAVVTYYYGSSSNSRAKDETIKGLSVGSANRGE